MQYTRLLGKYASELKYEDLPAEVIEQAKKITLHTIAVAIASMNVPFLSLPLEVTYPLRKRPWKWCAEKVGLLRQLSGEPI